MVLKTGIDGLDLVLDGCLRVPEDGSLFIAILGGAGTGKTNLAMALAVRSLENLQGRDNLVMYYSLDQSPGELYEKLQHDMGFYGTAGDRRRLAGALERRNYAALVQAVKSSGADPGGENILYLGSVRENLGQERITPESLFEMIDGDIEHFGRQTLKLGTALKPRLVCIDSVSLSMFDQQSGVRRSLRLIREHLQQRRIHGVLVLESSEEDASRASYEAAEYAADVIIQLGYHRFGDHFKERSIEILKARHQFYYRGTHHFSIVGRSAENQLRGARGQRAPGIHIYPSVPTLLSWIQYNTPAVAPAQAFLPMGFGGLRVLEHSANGLLGNVRSAEETLGLGLKFLSSTEHGSSLVISLKETRLEIENLVERRFPRLRNEHLRDRTLVLTFQPEYISSGKFLKDIHDFIEGKHRDGFGIERVLITNLAHLEWGFPLLKDAKILVPWLVEYFKRRGITSLFLESSIDFADRIPASSLIATTVDNLFAAFKNEERLDVRVEHALNLESHMPGVVVNARRDLEMRLGDDE
ncbi:MAG: ATPase domain-containing protein [Planctomycetota bacterium]